METGPLPAGWDPADPSTWRFVSEVVVAVPSLLRDPDDPVVARREVVTAATDHAHAGDPAIGLGMLPRRAAAWWADVLGPIHRARVAAVSHRRATEALLGGEHPPWEADPEDPIGVANPLLPGILEARSAAARVFLDMLGVAPPQRER
jgi:hypothetical protein